MVIGSGAILQEQRFALRSWFVSLTMSGTEGHQPHREWDGA
jgi:hypothetical protein